MALQSACIPIPSEVIMPFAGYKLAHGWLDLVIVATVASLASNLGSIPAYWLGAKGGRPMVERYGRFILLNGSRSRPRRPVLQPLRFNCRADWPHAADCADVHRVSGGNREDEQGSRFHIYTFLGSWPWCFALAYIGMKLGARWDDPKSPFKAVFHRFQLGVEVLIVVGFVWFVWTHWKNRVGAEHES